MILIVDDSPLILKIYSKVLEHQGINSKLIDNGEEAIEFVRRGHRVDLILMDINMPGTDGKEACAQIKKLNGAITILAISANPKQVYWDQIKGKGFADYFQKPLKLDEITSIAQTYLVRNIAAKSSNTTTSSFWP